MARIIKPKCEICGNEWEEDLDQYQKPVAVYKGVFRGEAPKTHQEIYCFRCRKCGTEWAVDAKIEE